MDDIKRAAVLGSGVMGGAIAAHLANCGIPSLMLDIVPPGLSAEDRQDPAKRNALAAASKAALLKTKPAPLYLPGNADLIEIGNFEDDFPRIAEADWVIEVVKEDLAIKKKVLGEAAKHRRPGSVISTNTSGILVRSMADGMDDDMRRQDILGAYLLGEEVPVAAHREAGVFESIGKANAFAMLRGVCQALRGLGFTGTVLLFDELDRNLSVGATTKNQHKLTDNLREIVDLCGRGALPGVLFAYAVPPEFMARVVDEYPALKQRLATLEAELAAARRTTAPADAELQSELDLMRSTRAAEIAALDDIMSGLELLIARAPRASDATYAEDVAPASGEVVAFDKSEG